MIKDQVRWTPYVDQSAHLYMVSYKARNYLTVRLSPNVDKHEAVRRVEDIIKRFDPAAPFEYKFQDDDYARLFDEEVRLGKLATIFSALAIAICCVGIFGLASFAASVRTKEIGIRKVLGASVFALWKMLSSDFIRLVVFALMAGCPLGYYFSSQCCSNMTIA
ncbi:MAG: hypothetical protein HC859_11340 [Bacteroidia bacterium]|nr:hypothetical protein [Bacteroidia bacterium]